MKQSFDAFTIHKNTLCYTILYRRYNTFTRPNRMKTGLKVSKARFFIEKDLSDFSAISSIVKIISRVIIHENWFQQKILNLLNRVSFTKNNKFYKIKV